MNVLNHKYGLIISLFIWLLACVFLQAADPTGLINYQGRLLDKYGRRVNTPVEIIFRIFNNNNDLLWSEKQDSIPVTDGLYSTILGSVTPLPSSIFNSDEVYFEIGINGETLTPRQRITAAPFALTARQAAGLKMPAGASAGYVLTSDGDGVGHWQAIAQITNGSDSITNWAQAVFKPGTNALWTAGIPRVL